MQQDNFIISLIIYFIKKETRHKFLRTTFFKEHLWCLLLKLFDSVQVLTHLQLDTIFKFFDKTFQIKIKKKKIMKIEKIERTSVSKACTLYGDKRFCF